MTQNERRALACLAASDDHAATATLLHPLVGEDVLDGLADRELVRREVHYRAGLGRPTTIYRATQAGREFAAAMLRVLQEEPARV